MFVHRLRNEQGFVDDREIDGLEQPLLGEDRCVCRIGENHVGVDGIVLHHGLDLGGIGVGSA